MTASRRREAASNGAYGSECRPSRHKSDEWNPSDVSFLFNAFGFAEREQ